MKTVSIIGAGSWGTTLAKMLAEKGELTVNLWARNQALVDEIKKEGKNQKYLPNIHLPKSINVTSDAKSVLPADLLVFVVPTHAFRETLQKFSPMLPDRQIILSCSKGLEENTALRMSQVIQKECPNAHIAVLSGPNHAIEVALKQPTAAVIACKNQAIAENIQTVFTTPYFRPYTNNDVVGVEFGGALKNIIAVAIGLLDGLGYQDNIKAATMTRGLSEISRLGTLRGAVATTFLGLSGTGDLISTCISKHSRNRWAGGKLAKGETMKDIVSQTNMVVEGIKTIKTVFDLSNRINTQLPITSELYYVIYEGKDIKKAVEDLMSRNRKSED